VTALEQVQHLIPQLNHAEMLELLHQVVDAIARDDIGIETDPHICGGEARIRHTRIPVWVLIQAGRLGQSDAEILLAYPGLSAENLAHAKAYARSHREEIDRDIHTNEAA
jgi:uncharacterized protein (DUF433 family)